MADKKHKATDFLFLSALLGAREARMLTQERAERMLDAASFEEAAKLLTDCGYEDMSAMSASEIDAFLARRRAECFNELEGMCPEKTPCQSIPYEIRLSQCQSPDKSRRSRNGR